MAMMFDRLKRITDLFLEGREVELGTDEDGSAVLIWVNKPNSFEEEEARRDGLAARTDRILELKDDTHPDVLNARSELQAWTQEQLVEARLNQTYDEDFLTALNDIESDKEWAEKLDYLRRNPTLLDDAAIGPDDPKRKRHEEINGAYMAAIRDAMDRLQGERRTDLASLDRAELEDTYLSDWRERDAFTAFIAEKRVTDLYFALRDCQASKSKDGKWDHHGCDHRRRLLIARADVRSLPQGVIDTVTTALEQMSASPREAGNSAAPPNSSARSEQPSAAEESTPSIPAVTPAGAPTT